MTRNKKPQVEIDAAKHHAALARAEGGPQYEYDPTLTAKGCYRFGVRTMSGLFICYACKHRNDGIPRVWTSGAVCTELYLSKDNTYRVVFNAQRCRECENFGRFKVQEKKYVDRVLDIFALWTGQREAHESTGPHKSTGPHDSDRCYGCYKGICPWSDDDEDDSNDKKKSKKTRRRRRR
ncbi:hypothetical protein BGZ96_004020 [Linnemannia gamsii]|uniref:3CxxC-type domain-containing protein n=1 Tax=Linnemannia gamsii TaxID=64522 RepID=A0ABQ7K6W7_9FUNG|nr:hypothetical protein BGZ96_004020 [Linnemannia gamsii]